MSGRVTGSLRVTAMGITGSPRELILPCLLLLLVACGGAAPIEQVEVPHPPLDRIDEAAREQLEAAKNRITGLPNGVEDAERASAIGELGRLYQGYGFTDAALASYTNAAALAGDEFRWLYYLGALELEAGQSDQGRQHLEQALELGSEDAAALLRLGQAALDLGDYADAAALYQRAAEAEPGCAAAYFGVGLAASGDGDHEAAVKAFVQTLDLEPSASQVHRPLAMAYRELGETDRARDSLARAGTAVPSCPDPLLAEIQRLVVGASALFERATLADLEGRSRAALDLVSQAVAADPNHAAARRLYGRLLITGGEYDAAIEQLEAAAESTPGDRRTYLLIGRAHRTAGRLAEAAGAFEQAIELDPRYSRARIELALARIEQHEWASARQVVEDGLTLEPDNLDLRVQLARTMAAMGDLSDSRDQLERVVAQNPAFASAHVALGSMDLEAESLESAKQHFETALEGEASAETYALAHYHLAGFATGRDDIDRAASHLATALELAPNMVEAQLAMGSLELSRDRTTQALKLFAAAAEQRPDLPQPRTGEALALLRSGRHLDARRKLEQASREFPRDPEIAHLLARVLATAPAPRVRDGRRALELASGLFSAEKTLDHGETVAMALAELERYDEAIEWQLRLLEQARGSETDFEVLAQLQSRLADYQSGRPARDAW